MLTPPAFKKDAVPSTRGWHDPRTGELLIARPMSQAEVDEYNGVVIHPAQEEELAIDQTILDEPVVEEVEEGIQFLTEADPTEELDLESLTTGQLKDMCDQYGITYGWTTRKSTLVEKLKAVV